MVFIAGFVDSIAGGGGLISLPAYLIAGIPVHNAIGTNKLSAGCGTFVSTSKYIKEGYVPWSLGIYCVIMAIIGGTIGSNLSVLLDEKVLKIIMMIALPIIGIYVLKDKSNFEVNESYSFKKTLMICLPLTLLIGIYDGLYGPGTGTFLMLVFNKIAKLDLRKSAGLCKIINLTTNLTSLTVFLLNGVVMIPLGLLCGVFGIAGNYLGARSFTTNGQKITRPIMLLVLVIFFIKVLSEII